MGTNCHFVCCVLCLFIMAGCISTGGAPTSQTAARQQELQGRLAVRGSSARRNPADCPYQSVSSSAVSTESVSTKIQRVSYEAPVETAHSNSVNATIDGKSSQAEVLQTESTVPDQLAIGNPVAAALPVSASASDNSSGWELDLGTALSMVGGDHPAVGFAQWRVEEAYAQLEQAKTLWLPSIRAGFSYHKHDGNLQASDGTISDVNRNSLQYGLGAGAVGAGTTPRQGITAEFHTRDAIFQPRIAEKTTWAREHAVNAEFNRQLLEVANAYIELLTAEQDRRIIEDSEKRMQQLSKLTGDFAKTGRGLQADADRMATETALIETRLIEARERADVASARLAQSLSVDANHRIVPHDQTCVPIDLVNLDTDKATLIATGLACRPELEESRALVEVACQEYQRQKFSPFIPSVLLGLSQTGFGGGVGSDVNDVDNRFDFDAMVTWEVRNFGMGERAARNATAARIEQAKFENVRRLDQVAREVSETQTQAIHRKQRIKIAQQAILTAENSYERNLRRIRDAQGLPLEVLQSVQALENARRAYLEAVSDYNQSQFQLQWALGWSVGSE